MKKVIFVMMSFIISLFGFSNICNAQSKGDLWRDFQNNFEGTYEFKDSYNKRFEIVLIYNYNTKKYLGAIYDANGKELARGEIYDYQLSYTGEYRIAIRTATLKLNKKVEICIFDEGNSGNRYQKKYITVSTDLLKFTDSNLASELYVVGGPGNGSSGNFKFRRSGIEESRRKSLMN